MSEVQDFIRETVTEHPVVLFMKGTAQMPQCGFSSRVVQILRAVGLNQVVTINVLDDEEVREGIKQFANWPTIPQLYIKGEFVGGSDIVSEMFESGELETMLREAGEKTDYCCNDGRHWRPLCRAYPKDATHAKRD